ncbi:GlxA family transcriptional regulator [Tropicibacter oceani]|uniref:Helix-turn-helix domain-containing protein n=1 Tax=Tropicibacter oceani TaxID=3058420 RepID=A0ABY8QE68_9RHOB|nr:helix-turn-helix domain-containing protein [Tropicibacter oceani]WGW02799.1 helix-turn-helix domain-containing protein [Tropicibacter oceani]
MQVSLVLFPEMPILTYALTHEVLTLANRCAGRDLFSWQCRTVTGQPITTQEGVALPPDLAGWQDAESIDLILLCAGSQPLRHLPMGLRGFLGRAATAQSTLGGLGTGTLVLAELGHLEGREAVLEGADQVEHRGKWPGIARSGANFCMDRQRLTARSGLPVVDALSAWIGRTASPALAAQVSDAFSPGPLAKPGETQKLPRTSDPVLMRMQAVMASNLEQPIALEVVARELELSPKQMRTRCQNGLGVTPMHAYLQLRLDRARALVRETELSVQDIATATGFVSPSAFTRSYRTHFGETPRDMRAARRPRA